MLSLLNNFENIYIPIEQNKFEKIYIPTEQYIPIKHIYIPIKQIYMPN